MKRVLLTTAAVLLSLSTASFAQTTTASRNNVNNDRAATMNANNGANGSMSASGMFATVPSQDELSSQVVGLDVYNNANENIGKIKDVAFDQSGVRAYIVAVGGVLGMGDHYVAVSPSAIRISYDSNNKKWHAAMNTNVDQLKAAPEYRYSSNG
jgi:sporulation protein YlmC with PRC-barrel domain